MKRTHPLGGVYAAAVTPLLSDLSPDLEAIPQFLGFLARRGCHGALLLGTTGEGPSFSPQERTAILRAAVQVRQEHPEFHLFAGTGTPSLEETVELTRTAFDLGVDAVVVLPPYYYRSAGDEGLFAWYRQVLQRAVPAGGTLLGYHIPPVSGVPLSLDLLTRLKEGFPDRFGGLKDSSGEPEHARRLGEAFGSDLLVFSGNERLLSLALENQATGSITAPANIISPALRKLWDAYQAGEPVAAIQECIQRQRAVLDRYPPAPPLLKALLARRFGFPLWPVKPPLCAAPEEIVLQASADLDEVDHLC